MLRAAAVRAVGLLWDGGLGISKPASTGACIGARHQRLAMGGCGVWEWRGEGTGGSSDTCG